MVALVHDQRLARGQAGAHRRRARAVFAPLCAQVQPGVPQVGRLRLVAQKIHRHAVPVCQQEHVVQPLELLVKPFQPAARNADQRFGFVLVNPQLAFGDDVGLARLRRVQPMVVDAAAPAAQHGLIALAPARGVAQAKGFDLLGVRCVGLKGHGKGPQQASTQAFCGQGRRRPTWFTQDHGGRCAPVGATPVASRAPPVARRNGRARGVPNRDFPRAGVLSL